MAWSLYLQTLMSTIFIAGAAFGVYCVLLNYEGDHSATVHERSPGVSFDTHIVTMNIVAFVATFISRCEDILSPLMDKILRNRCSPLVLKICKACIDLTCKCFFDYKIFHIINTSRSLRSSVVSSDIVFALLKQAVR